MIRKISHIGLAVENLEEAQQFFDENFSLQASAKENFGELLFSFVSFEESGAQLELLESTSPDGQIAKFIRKKGQGIHHIAFEVDDIEAELNNLEQKGIRLINEKPYRNAHQELVAFIHPKSTYGVLIELVQSEQ